MFSFLLKRSCTLRNEEIRMVPPDKDRLLSIRKCPHDELEATYAKTSSENTKWLPHYTAACPHACYVRTRDWTHAHVSCFVFLLTKSCASRNEEFRKILWQKLTSLYQKTSARRIGNHICKNTLREHKVSTIAPSSVSTCVLRANSRFSSPAFFPFCFLLKRKGRLLRMRKMS